MYFPTLKAQSASIEEWLHQSLSQYVTDAQFCEEAVNEDCYFYSVPYPAPLSEFARSVTFTQDVKFHTWFGPLGDFGYKI